MTLDPKYVVTSDVDTYFVNKDTGLPLANGQLIFYRDSARNVPKAVFELSGTPPNYTYTSMGAVVTLSTSGTVEDSQGSNQVIYYRPYILDSSSGLDVLDLYYVVGQDENGVVQFTREAWPNISPEDAVSDEVSPVTNQIANPTFTNVFLNTAAAATNAISVSGAVNQAIPIAPDWDLVVSGSGLIQLSQLQIAGVVDVPTSPPSAIDISVGLGITQCNLRQRFSYNSGLWASTGSSTNNPVFLTGGFVAQNQNPGNQTLQMFYNASSGGSPVQILSGVFGNNYTIVQGGTAVQIPNSSDTNLGKNGYVDIYISLPTNSHVIITSILLVPSFKTSQTVGYDLDSSNRNEAYQGDYYIPRLNAKPTNSLLVGWDFEVSPYQFAKFGNQAGVAGYLTDQTIFGLSTGLLNFTKDVTTGGLFLNKTAGNGFYIMQYLTGSAVKKMLGTKLSVNVFAYTDAATNVDMRVYLFRAGSTGAIPILPTTLGNVAADGTFTLTAANWTEIPRGGLPTALATLKVVIGNDINNGNNDYGFSQWQITDAAQILDTDKFAIVVSFSAIGHITVNSISLVPGDIPCRPAIQSQDETLRQCQYYYSKSFFPSTFPAQGLGFNTGESYSSQVFGSAAANALGPIISFSTSMRATPNITLYNPVSNNALIRDLTANLDWIVSSTIFSTISANGFATVGTTPSGSSSGDLAALHWSADVRLGVV